MISIIVPVYNSPKEVSLLLDTLYRNSDFTIVREIIVGNDCSDRVTDELLTSFEDRSGFIHVRRDSNLGFLKNTNDLFARASGQLVVLMNSDTIVPPNWTERVLKAMTSSPDIALACPFTTNATNLVIKPAAGQSWLDVDFVLSQQPASYPPCQPIVGFFLAIRRDVFLSEPLLDEAFGNGYWEDTDLHFRSVSRGFRNIVIDNLLVFHSNHSPSFAQDHNLEQINDVNRALFMKRWRLEHNRMAAAVDLVGAASMRHTMAGSPISRFLNRRDYDVLFILPAAIPAVGGISVVMEIVDELNHLGCRSAVLVTTNYDARFVDQRFQTTPFQSVISLKDAATSCRFVFSTSWDTHELAKEIASYFGASFCHFSQGPEYAFNSGLFATNILENLLEYDLVLCVSEYLRRSLECLNVAAQCIPVGPSKFRYYPARRKRREKSIAICLRTNPLKGTGFAMTLASIAMRVGFEVHVFGHDEGEWRLPGDRCIRHGALGPTKLRELFSSVEYYIDCSMMEGLGLLPLEAAFCGAIPVVRSLNGLEGILVNGVNCIVLGKDLVPESFFLEISNQERASLQAAGVALREARSIEAASEAIIDALNLSVGAFRGTIVPARQDVGSTNMLAQLQAELDRSRAAVQQLRSSTSWALTAPLRWLATTFRIPRAFQILKRRLSVARPFWQ